MASMQKSMDELEKATATTAARVFRRITASSLIESMWRAAAEVLTVRAEEPTAAGPAGEVGMGVAGLGLIEGEGGTVAVPASSSAALVAGASLCSLFIPRVRGAGETTCRCTVVLRTSPAGVTAAPMAARFRRASFAAMVSLKGCMNKYR